MANAVGMKDAKIFNNFPFWKKIYDNIVISNEELINKSSIVSKDFVNTYENTILAKIRITLSNGYDIDVYGYVLDDTGTPKYSFGFGRTQSGYSRCIESVFILPKGYTLRIAFRNYNSTYARSFTYVIDVIEIIQE